MNILVFLQQLANGISLGSLYALLAIGYTMVYGILRLTNFAHGEIFMIGSFLAFYGVAFTSLPWWLIFTVTSIITGLLGVLLERVAYKPLRSSAIINMMISAIGASYLLQNLGVLVFGGRPKAFPIPSVLRKAVNIGGVSVSSISLIIPGVTIVLLIILTYVLQKTKTGMAMRALSMDQEAANLMGINIDLIISITFFIGSFLAGVGGVMWSIKYPQIQPLMGVTPGIKCFIVAVIGGIGSISGAVLGGYILGLGEILLIAFLPNLTGYRDAFAFVLLIITLLIKPTGIMGKKEVEKV